MRFKFVLLLFLLAALTASAGPISGDVQAQWTSIPFVAWTDPANVLLWGIGSPSKLSFSEGDFDESTGVNFALTTLSFYNGVNSWDATGDDFNARATISVIFTVPSGWSPNPAFTFEIPVDNKFLAKDEIKFNNTALGTPQTKTLDGWQYTLSLRGFVKEGADPNGALLSGLSVSEGGTGRADLIARLDAVQTTPEPATTSMFVLGLGVLLAARKFRRAR